LLSKSCYITEDAIQLAEARTVHYMRLNWVQKESDVPSWILNTSTTVVSAVRGLPFPLVADRILFIIRT